MNGRWRSWYTEAIPLMSSRGYATAFGGASHQTTDFDDDITSIA